MSQRKKANISFVVSMVILALLFGIRLYNRHSGDYSCTLTIMVSCDNSVATVITLIDTNGEDLMSAITG